MRSQVYNLVNIRELLTEGFNVQDLRRLCYEVPDFRAVYDDLAPDTGKSRIVELLVGHAERTLQIDTLLLRAKELNPARYELHGPYQLMAGNIGSIADDLPLGVNSVSSSMANTGSSRSTESPISIFDTDFVKAIEQLRRSFAYNKGVPLTLNGASEPQYYTSTTATTLLALHYSGSLESGQYDEFYDTLFWLRDNTVNLVRKDKMPEDAPAWDVADSASVWDTSLAIWALLGTGYDGPRISEIRDAVVWLIDQQRSDGGWGFDKQSISHIFFTSLALHALKLSLSRNVGISTAEQNRIKRARNFGIQFVLQNYHKKGKIAYCFLSSTEPVPDPTLTLCAIWALFEEDPGEHKDLIQHGIQFLQSELEGKDIWEFRRIVSETHTKYGSHKVVESYTPAFVIFLLRAGCSPYDEICLRPIRWLVSTRRSNGWGFPGQAVASFSFTTAYAVWSIANWYKYAIKKSLAEAEEHPYVVRGLRRRITLLLGAFLSLAVCLVCTETEIVAVVKNAYGKAMEYNSDLQLIAAVLALLGISGVYPLLRYLDSHVLNKGISRALWRARKVVWRVLYLDY